jgi:hypothetical protein
MKDDARGAPTLPVAELPLWTRSGTLAWKAAGQGPSLISRLELRSILEHTMESLEIIVLPVILVGALLLGAIWTTTAVHWLRSTKPLR